MVWLVRYSEIFLKGRNRAFFEKKLVRNIRECLAKNSIAYEYVTRLRNRILVKSDKDCTCLRYVFGIASFSRAIEVGENIENIKEAALRVYKGGSFRISAKCIDTKLSSTETNRIIGRYIVEKTGAVVSLENFDTEIGIELLNGRAYVFNEKISGPGGMPVGTSGRVAVLLEDDDSVRAAYFMLKRGCSVVFVGKKKIDFSWLEEYAYGSRLKQLSAIPHDALAVATSERLNNIKERELGLPILRPLIGQ